MNAFEFFCSVGSNDACDLRQITTSNGLDDDTDFGIQDGSATNVEEGVNFKSNLVTRCVSCIANLVKREIKDSRTGKVGSNESINDPEAVTDSGDIQRERHREWNVDNVKTFNQTLVDVTESHKGTGAKSI